MNTQFPLIKICGIKHPAHALYAAEQGAQFIGMVFHEASKRHITLEAAIPVSEAAIYGDAVPVPVFVNQTAEEMLHICKILKTTVIQLHGDTSRKEHFQLPESITRIYVLPVNHEGKTSINSQEAFKHLNILRDYLLFDGLVGGSGNLISLQNLHAMAQDFRFFLAGGLNANNVDNAIKICNPYGVDISSGVEDETGEKCLSLIKEFIANARSLSTSPCVGHLRYGKKHNTISAEDKGIQ